MSYLTLFPTSIPHFLPLPGPRRYLSTTQDSRSNSHLSTNDRYQIAVKELSIDWHETRPSTVDLAPLRSEDGTTLDALSNNVDRSIVASSWATFFGGYRWLKRLRDSQFRSITE